MSTEGIIQPVSAIAREGYETCLPSAVPRARDAIQPLVSAAVDVFWQRRRYGEPWDEVVAPQSYLAADDDDVDATDICAVSRRVHRRLVFDLVAEILRDIYSDDDVTSAAADDDDPSSRGDCGWPRRRPPPRRPRHFSVAHPPPTTVDCVKPAVERHVFACLGLTPADQPYHPAAEPRTPAARKRGIDRRLRDDAVDRMLVEELGLEEPGWVDYDDDVTTRKLQLADWLHDALLADTVFAVDSALRRRRHALALLNSLV